MLSDIVACIAAEPSNIPPDSIVMNSFEVGEIPDLGHPVCTLSLADNKKEDFYNYVEGDICPPGGGNCTYSAIMKLNGEIAILKQVSSGKTASVFKNGDISITTIQASIKKSNVEEEGNNVKFIITIKTKNSEKKLDMSGYCGV